MAQVKLLKVASGLPTEMDSSSDDVTLASYTVTGGGPVLNSNLDMNNGSISDAGGLSFTDPATDGITQTAGLVEADNLMAKERTNVMTTAGDVLFPVISDAVGEVDAFRLPALAGVPSATPTAGGEGYLVWDSTNDDLYVWNGSSWDNLSSVTSAGKVCNSYTATSALAIAEAVYIDGSNSVDLADASAVATSECIGFAEAAISAAASGNICTEGVVGGFTGLTAGDRLYLSETAGAVTATPPTTSGAVQFVVGFAKSATQVQIHKQFIGVNA